MGMGISLGVQLGAGRAESFNPPPGTVWVFSNGFLYDPGVWLDQVVWALASGTFNDNGVWMDEVM